MVKYEIDEELMEKVIDLLGSYALNQDDKAYDLRRALIAVKKGEA